MFHQEETSPDDIDPSGEVNVFLETCQRVFLPQASSTPLLFQVVEHGLHRLDPVSGIALEMLVCSPTLGWGPQGCQALVAVMGSSEPSSNDMENSSSRLEPFRPNYFERRAFDDEIHRWDHDTPHTFGNHFTETVLFLSGELDVDFSPFIDEISGLETICLVKSFMEILSCDW